MPIYELRLKNSLCTFVETASNPDHAKQAYIDYLIENVEFEDIEIERIEQEE